MSLPGLLARVGATNSHGAFRERGLGGSPLGNLAVGPMQSRQCDAQPGFILDGNFSGVLATGTCQGACQLLPGPGSCFRGMTPHVQALEPSACSEDMSCWSLSPPPWVTLSFSTFVWT